jgi:hypothetical protein
VIRVHPAADLFPMMTADELMVLGDDIKKNGLHVPVILWQAEKDALPMLLDGRNRLDASEAVGLRVLDKGFLTDCFKLEIGRDPYETCAFPQRRSPPSAQRIELVEKVLRANRRCRAVARPSLRAYRRPPGSKRAISSKQPEMCPRWTRRPTPRAASSRRGSRPRRRSAATSTITSPRRRRGWRRRAELQAREPLDSLIGLPMEVGRWQRL